MADKKLNEVPVVSDIVTIFGKRSNGEIVQIDKSNLATLLGELMFPKYTSSELNYGDLNEFKSPTIKTINRWSNSDFPKTNWPDEITYGTFIVEQINDVIRQTAVSESLCIRFYYSSTGEWSEWMIY